MIRTTGDISARPKFIAIKMEVKGEKPIQRFIKNVGIEGSKLREPLRLFGNYMLTVFSMRFGAEQGRQIWQGLSEGTIKARKRRWGYYRQPSSQGAEHMVLQWTGKLMRSFTRKGAAGNIFILSNRELSMGSNIPYAAYHHGPKGVKMPQRRVAFFSDVNRYNLNKFFHEHILGAIKKSRQRAGK